VAVAPLGVSVVAVGVVVVVGVVDVL